MTVIKSLTPYSDERGNKIVISDNASQIALAGDVTVFFGGENNTLYLDSRARVRSLNIRFDCNNGRFELGGNVGVGPFSGVLRVGEDSSIKVGDNVSCTTSVQISAVEGTEVVVGDDVMIASNVKLRGDDGQRAHWSSY